MGGIQISDITGVSGVSFFIVLVNVFLFLTLRWASYRFRKGNSVTGRFPLVYGFLTVLVLVTVTGYGWVRLKDIRYHMKHSPSIRVALVQGNIDQSQKWDPANFRKTLSIYQELSEKAAGKTVDLIVWPETAVPGYYVPDLVDSQVVRSVANRVGTPIVFGSLSYDRQGTRYRTFNSAFLVSPGEEEIFRYDKIHLVPFGEYVPLKPLMPFVDKLVEGIGEFSAGKEHTLFSTPKALCGVLICYEVIFPRYACAYARKGANVLVNITNDAWFGKTGATYQHLSLAAFRAVETRLPLIRAANTGVSALVSPTGKITAQTTVFIKTFLTGSVPIFCEPTFFVHYRRMFDFLCAVIVGFIALRAHLFRKEVDT
jgi:apolipoprotein N-acyltransferase